MSFLEDLRNTFKSNSNTLMQLIVINCIAFILLNIVAAVCQMSGIDEYVILNWFLLPSDFKIFLGRLWTIFIYMFLHLNLWHIFSNMLWLYWMGSIFNEYLGSKRLVAVYIFGGLSGGALFVVLSNLMPLFTGQTYLLGASASVMAIVVAIAVLLPEYSIYIMFIGPVRLKYIALISFVLTTVIDLSQNTGGKIAHVGGALFGFIYIMQYKRGRDISNIFYKVMNLFSFKRNKIKVVHSRKKEEEVLTKAGMQRKVDEILDKIAKSGYESLSKEEKEILFKASNRL